MIGVKLEVSRRAASSGITLETAMDTLIATVQHPLAGEIKARVQERGDLAGQPFPGWRQQGKRRYATASTYPDKAQGRVGPSGAEWYDSRPAYQRANASRPGAYSPTGGMWGGLSDIVESKARGTIQFRGRSIGANPNFRRATRGKSKGHVVERPLRINNSLKAATILKAHGVNVLAITEVELDAIARRVVNRIGMGVGRQLDVEWQWPPRPEAA